MPNSSIRSDHFCGLLHGTCSIAIAKSEKTCSRRQSVPKLSRIVVCRRNFFSAGQLWGLFLCKVVARILGLVCRLGRVCGTGAVGQDALRAWLVVRPDDVRRRATTAAAAAIAAAAPNSRAPPLRRAWLVRRQD